jgi:hypothetical protein
VRETSCPIARWLSDGPPVDTGFHLVSVSVRWILAVIATVEIDGAVDGELAAIAEVPS